MCISLNAQTPAPQTPGVHCKTTPIPSFPPYSLNMPYDVMIGYLAMDSVARFAQLNDERIFVERQTSLTDTSRYIMKYAYAVSNWDGVYYQRVQQYFGNNVNVPPNWMASDVIKIVNATSTNKPLDYSLMFADVIARIHIDNITPITYPAGTKGAAAYMYLVNCTIIDTIKGRIIPNCQQLI